MKRLLMLQGLPGSGKTTIALGLVRRALDRGVKAVRVNKDDIRRQLEDTEGWVWSPENEARVIAIRDADIARAFDDGCELVVSDDTNFGRKHKTRLAEIAAQHQAIFEIQKVDTPVGECVRRDALREGKAHVGESVILDMAKRFNVGIAPYYEKFTPYMNTPGKPMAVLCDLDGTLALHNGRSPYDYKRCSEDVINAPILMTLRALSHYTGALVIYCSGRSDEVEDDTRAWLKRHLAPEGLLYMRKAGDCRPDWLVKGEIFDAHIRDRYNVLLVLDDRTQVVRLWRHLGLTCLQVADGDF